MVKKRAKTKSINNKDIPLSKSAKPKTELTELEKFYVEQKCRDGVTLAEIKKQNISPFSLVEQLYNQTVADVQDENKLTAGKLLSRNENYGAVVMTPQSSEFADADRPTSKSPTLEKKESHIHKFH